MKRYICEAKTSGPIESATLVIKADCCDDAREILVGTLGLGSMDIRVIEMMHVKPSEFAILRDPSSWTIEGCTITTVPSEEYRAARLERDQRARSIG